MQRYQASYKQTDSNSEAVASFIAKHRYACKSNITTVLSVIYHFECYLCCAKVLYNFATGVFCKSVHQAKAQNTLHLKKQHFYSEA